MTRRPRQVAHLHGAPFLALKGITDIVDGDRPPQEEFLENLHRAAQALQARIFALPPGAYFGHAAAARTCVGPRSVAPCLA